MGNCVSQQEKSKPLHISGPVTLPHLDTGGHRLSTSTAPLRQPSINPLSSTVENLMSYLPSQSAPWQFSTTYPNPQYNSLVSSSDAICDLFKTMEKMLRESEMSPQLQSMLSEFGTLLAREFSVRDAKFQHLLSVESKANRLQHENDRLLFVLEATRLKEKWWAAKESRLEKEVSSLQSENEQLKLVLTNQSSSIQSLHKAIAALTKGQFFPADEGLFKCPICTFSYTATRHPVVGRCGHSVCQPCVGSWLLPHCPICRGPGAFSQKPCNYLANGLIALISPFLKNEENGQDDLSIGTFGDDMTTVDSEEF